MFTVLWYECSLFFLWSSVPQVSFPSLWGTVPKTQTTIGITFTFMNNSFFFVQLSSKIQVSFNIFALFNFTFIIIPGEFFILALADGLSQHSEWQSPQVSETLLSILADLNNTAVWMVSSSPLNKPLGTIPSSPITIGNALTFVFYIYFSSLARSKYLFLF